MVVSCLETYCLGHVKQDKQCMCNLTLRRFLSTIVGMESSKYYVFWLCVCNFSYPACNARATYCPMRPVQLYDIFPHYHKRYDFRGKKRYWTRMCVL